MQKGVFIVVQFGVLQRFSTFPETDFNEPTWKLFMQISKHLIEKFMFLALLPSFIMPVATKNFFKALMIVE